MHSIAILQLGLGLYAERLLTYLQLELQCQLPQQGQAHLSCPTRERKQAVNSRLVVTGEQETCIFIVCPNKRQIREWGFYYAPLLS